MSEAPDLKSGAFALAVVERKASRVQRRDLDTADLDCIAGGAGKGQKINFGFHRVGFAPHQPHQAATVLAGERSDGLTLSDFNGFHTTTLDP